MKEVSVSTLQTKTELALIKNDVSHLTSEERIYYYNELCESLGLNPLSQPFGYIEFRGGKISLYAKKDCTDQLRKIHNVSIKITSRSKIDDIYVVSALATNKEGREDEDIGAVPFGGLKGEYAANAIMKAITKAKRRVTLSFCGLGMLDESEIETIKDAVKVDGIEKKEEFKRLPAPSATQPEKPQETDNKKQEQKSTIAKSAQKPNVNNYAPNAPLNGSQQMEIFRHIKAGEPDPANQKEMLKVIFKVDSYRSLVTEHYKQFKKTIDMGMSLFDEYMNILELENALDAVVDVQESKEAHSDQVIETAMTSEEVEALDHNEYQ